MSARPVRQIAQGAERPANIIEEKTAESESAETKAKEDFKESIIPQYSTPVEGRGEVKESMKAAKEEGTIFVKKKHEDHEDLEAFDVDVSIESSINESKEELKEVAGKYDAKLLEGQLSAVFENKIKQHKDEISVDPIEEVADTTTKPVKIKEANKVKANEDKIRQMKMKMKKEVGISSIKRKKISSEITAEMGNVRKISNRCR